ncbi:MAG: hypothetical protein ACK4KV_16480 [Rhodocyclaceae bacterium]
MKALPAALSLAIILAACTRSDTVTDVTLAELAARQHAYDGQTVRTRGTVRSFDSPRHYWLEDDHLNRVGLTPVEHIAPHLDRQVTVVGRYTFTRDRGRRIVLEAIEAYDPPR